MIANNKICNAHTWEENITKNKSNFSTDYVTKNKNHEVSSRQVGCHYNYLRIADKEDCGWTTIRRYDSY